MAIEEPLEFRQDESPSAGQIELEVFDETPDGHGTGDKSWLTSHVVALCNRLQITPLSDAPIVITVKNRSFGTHKGMAGMVLRCEIAVFTAGNDYRTFNADFFIPASGLFLQPDGQA